MRERAHRLLVACLVLGAAAACESRSPPRAREREARAPDVTEARMLAPVEPLAYRVLREEEGDVGAGRLILHILVPAESSDPQIRHTLETLLSERAERDATLVAVRVIAYRGSPLARAEVELVPVAWGEWLPPEGWVAATAASRQKLHRIYTYFGAEPEW